MPNLDLLPGQTWTAKNGDTRHLIARTQIYTSLAAPLGWRYLDRNGQERMCADITMQNWIGQNRCSGSEPRTPSAPPPDPSSSVPEETP